MGRFLDRFRDAGRAFFGSGAGRRSDAPADASQNPLKDADRAVRATALGHGPQYPISDHRNELGHNTGWTFPAVRAIGCQWAQAAWTAYDSRQGKTASKSGRFADIVRKDFASDAPAEHRTPLQNHPALKLLDRPNPIKSGAEFRYQIAQQLALTGGYVVWEVRNQLGLPYELWVLPRGWLTFQVPSQRFPMGSWRVYPSRLMSGGWTGGASVYTHGFEIDVRETIIGGWPDALVPGEFTSPMAACDKIIDIAEMADLATWNALTRAPRPGMILSVQQPGIMTPDQIAQIKEEIELDKGGSDNVGKVLVFQNVEKQDLGTPLSELDAVNVRNQALEQTLLVHGVPTLAIGKLDGATYSGNAAALNGWTELGIQPGMSLFASTLQHRWQSIWPGLELELNAKRYDDPTMDLQRVDKVLAAFDKGCATGNEVRAALKLPPHPELDELQKPQEQSQAVGPDGQPIPSGVPDPTGQGQHPQDSDPLDIGIDDLGDDETTGIGDASKAGMPTESRSRFTFSRNGTGVH